MPAQESTDLKVIAKACDNFLRYELNANRALARETCGSSEAGANPDGVATGAEATAATGVRVRTSHPRRRADVVTPGGAAVPALLYVEHDPIDNQGAEGDENDQ